MEEHVFTEAFLQARVDELTSLGVQQNPDRSITEVIALVRSGQAGEEMGRWDAQVYSAALDLLGNSLVYWANVGSLLDALDVYLAE